MTSLRILLSSLVTALVHPRVYLTAWLAVTVAAVASVLPVFALLDNALSHHPAATTVLDQALDADFERAHPHADVALGGGSIGMLIVFAFLSGGILTCVGTARKFSYTEFLAEGARFFLRNLRVIFVGAIVSAIVFWGVESLDRVIREHWVYEWDMGPPSFLKTRWLSLELGIDVLQWLWGFVFIGLLLVSKMAMAQLAASDRRSALLAWSRAMGVALRHPLRSATITAVWLAVFMLGSHIVGEVTVRLMEVRGELWFGLAVGQVGVIWTQVLFVTFLLAARSFAFPASRRVPTDPGNPEEDDVEESLSAA